jgi:enolase
MTRTAITELDAMEILDSRGKPTLRVMVQLRDGTRAVAAVPSGASTGTQEAVELRDGGPRYAGMGVKQAARNVTEILFPRLRGLAAGRQADIDMAMRDLDGTWNKSRLGANAILGVSMAVARAAALSAGQSLYQELSKTPHYLLPVPMMNIINGGAHSNNSLDFQEFMIVPHGASSFAEALRYGVAVFQALKTILQKSGFSTSVGDEGGFAPPLKSNEAALDLMMEAIHLAGLRAGMDVSLAIDVAASTFATANGYDLSRSGLGHVSSSELLALYMRWAKDYPLVSIEDGFGENDWGSFKDMTAALGQKLQIVGDDNYVTHKFLIQQGIYEQTSNAALIKLNQIGTVTETIAAVDLCHKAGWRAIISHRSGETEDTFIADLSVATAAGQIKAGSVCRGERVAKYNRLLEIERELGNLAVFNSPFNGINKQELVPKVI